MIKEAVESSFGVKVKAVNTSSPKQGKKRFRGPMGSPEDVRRPYVCPRRVNGIDVSYRLCKSDLDANQ